MTIKAHRELGGIMEDINKRETISEIIRGIYALTAKLSEMYPGRHFTPDGHMVGSLGEVMAAERYGLELYEASHETYDAYTLHGERRAVQIKTTQTNRVGIGEKPDYLIVLHLNPEGEFEEVYNGPGEKAWEAAGKMQKNGQRQISLAKLRRLNGEVELGQSIYRCSDAL